jgi:hypothetical protein
MASNRPNTWQSATLRALTLLALASIAAGCGQERHAIRYLLPEGYTGGVAIVYGVKGAAALPMEDGRLLVRIPRDGLLRTSTTIEYGLAKDEYFYYSGTTRRPLKLIEEGGGGLIWGGTIGEYGTEGTKGVEESFSVGPEQRSQPSSPQPSSASWLDLLERFWPYAWTYLLGFSVLGFCRASYQERLSPGQAIGRIWVACWCSVPFVFLCCILLPCIAAALKRSH